MPDKAAGTRFEINRWNCRVPFYFHSEFMQMVNKHEVDSQGVTIWPEMV